MTRTPHLGMTIIKTGWPCDPLGDLFLSLVPIDLSPNDYKGQVEVHCRKWRLRRKETSRYKDWRHSEQPPPPPCASYSCLFILDPIIFVRTVKILPGGQTQKDFEGRWEALSRLITKETRWQFKSRRNDHKWMARGFSTSRRDCQNLNSNPPEILIANWTMKTIQQISLQIESKITKLVQIL